MGGWWINPLRRRAAPLTRTTKPRSGPSFPCIPAASMAGKIDPKRMSLQSKSDLVANALREMIAVGEVLPGTPLRQREIAARLGVSSTPVREAIRQLQSEGLVRTELNRGAMVAGSNALHLEESLRILTVLEALAGRLALERITDQDLTEVQRLHDELAVGSDDERRRRDLNRTFHFRVYECSKSPMLMSIMRLLWASFPGGPQYGRPFEESVEQHGLLVEALWRRDADGVALAIEQHVIGSITYVRQRAVWPQEWETGGGGGDARGAHRQKTAEDRVHHRGGLPPVAVPTVRRRQSMLK